MSAAATAFSSPSKRSTADVIAAKVDAGEELIIGFLKLASQVTDLDNDAEFCNKKFGAFISEDLFEKYKNLYKACHEFERMFGVWSIDPQGSMIIFNGAYMTREELKAAFVEKQKVISSKSDQLLKDLRKYINSLECE